MMRPSRWLACLLLLFGLCGGIQAAERLTAFHSVIDIATDGSMVVEETIEVVAEGKSIRRGIYRDFPTRYSDRYGNLRTVDFEVLDVTRDGGGESWHTRRRSNGVRLYIGSEHTFLNPGRYTYRIRYRTDWQLGFFEKGDELYWNVTGNGWEFPIERAGVLVRLPEAVNPEQLRLEGYTGRQGERGRDYTGDVAAGEGRARTTRTLGPGEGLTVVFTWPKGVVEEPGGMRRLSHLLAANGGLALALFAFFGGGAYLLFMWHRYGRDPEAGVVFPHYEPPEGYSPASLRYIQRMGYDNDAFTAAVINLAVKGHLTIEKVGEDYSLRRTPSKEKLAPGERTLLNRLFRSGSTLQLEQPNHFIVSGARTAHSNALKKDYRNIYFRTNGRLLLPTLLGCALCALVVTLKFTWTPLVMGLLGATLALHILFAWLMKAPSPRGRRLMDRSAGFKLYLEVAEKDDLNLRNPPELTPQLFEAYLPFAIALGVEQAWAEQFAAVLSQIRDPETGAGYSPHWYHGSFNPGQMGAFSQSVGSGLSSAISSAATAPGSSSGGGGGGFSGGGGGGGGGGGW